VQGLLSLQLIGVCWHPEVTLQESTVQRSESVQFTAVNVQAPLTHLLIVQLLLLLQFTWLVILQAPELGSQETGKQRSPFNGGHVTTPVELLQWLHAWGVCVHPLAGEQESTKQGLLELHIIFTCTQPMDGEQESLVQALLSSQFMGEYVHPFTVSHVLFVQALVVEHVIGA
jgi:hypothetical protein